jgi:hypothetical protein
VGVVDREKTPGKTEATGFVDDENILDTDPTTGGNFTRLDAIHQKCHVSKEVA